MNVLVLGDTLFERIFPVLKQISKYILVVAGRALEKDLLFGAEVEYYINNTSVDQKLILKLIDEKQIDLVIPRIRGTENELDVIEYALAAELTSPAVKFATHPLNFAQTVVNKVFFHQFAEHHRLPVPHGFVCHNTDDAYAAIEHFGGFPVILKKDMALAREGTYYIDGIVKLKEFFRVSLKRPFIVQEVIEGEELGIEVISSPQRSYRFPLISTGSLNRTLNPQGRVRSVPYYVTEKIQNFLHEKIDYIERVLCPSGPWQLDLAISADKLYILEINPRLGGLSLLDFYATDLDPHVVTCLTAIEKLCPQPTVVRAAFELPIVPGTEIQDIYTESLKVHIQKPRSKWQDWKLAISSENADLLISFINQIPETVFLVSKLQIMNKIMKTFQN